MGSILFRLLVAIALRWGLNPNDLKLITALFVFAALILPGAIVAVKSHLSPRSAIQTESN
jgi:putative ABC transport system permease protein